MRHRHRLIDDIIAEFANPPTDEGAKAPNRVEYESIEDDPGPKARESARLSTFYTLSTSERKYTGAASPKIDGPATAPFPLAIDPGLQRVADAGTEVPIVRKAAAILGHSLGTSGLSDNPPAADYPTAARALLAGLDPDEPIADFPLVSWQLFLSDARRLTEGGWLQRAEELGWSWCDLFGADQAKPYARIDKAGLAFLLAGNRLVAMSIGAALIETNTGVIQKYQRRFTHMMR
jgi:hypothetical protein